MYVLAIVAVAIIVVAILEIGPPTSSARTSKEVVTAENGVVQSTVTGTGNVEAGTDVDVNFKTSGTLQHVYVSEGQHVIKGQLLATLDPTSAQLGVDQAEEQLTAAQDQLTAVENGTATGSGSGGSGTDGRFVDDGQPERRHEQHRVRLVHASEREVAPEGSTLGAKSKQPSTTPKEKSGSSNGSSSGSSNGSSSGSSGSSSRSGSSHSGGSPRPPPLRRPRRRRRRASPRRRRRCSAPRRA